MASSLLILLIGGRTQPATLLALNHQPDLISLVASHDSQDEAKFAQQLLTKLLPQSLVEAPRFVHPYRPSQTSAAILAILQEHPSMNPAVSLTSAPMPMGIGAVEIAKQYSFPAYYFNTAAGEMIDLAAEDAPATIQLSVTIEDYLQTHESGITTTQKPEPLYRTTVEQRASVMQQFVEQPHRSAELLNWLRRKTDLTRQQRITKKWPQEFDEHHWAMLDQMHHHSIFRFLERVSQTQVRFQLASVSEGEFLKGTWLEEYIQTAAQQAEIVHAPAFDSCYKHVKLISGKAEREIDFIGIRRGVLLIASAKTGNDRWQKTNVDELAAVARLLGGRYCIRLYITNAPEPRPSDLDFASYQHFVQQAIKQHIVVITGDNLHHLPAILAAELPTPTFGLR